MPYPFKLEVGIGLPGLVVSGVNPRPDPQCVLNEHLPQGLLDRVIKNDQAWDVTFYWNVSGLVAEAIGPFDWNCCVYLLCLSNQGGVSFSKYQQAPYKTGADSDYIVKVDIPPTTQGGVPVGMYKLYTSIDVIHSPAVLPVTMFGEGPTMKFYKPG